MDDIIVKEIAEEVKLRLQIEQIDMETNLMLEDVVKLVISMYLSKNIRSEELN